MEKSEDGESMVNIGCFCEDKGCCGNLHIQPDKVAGRKLFMVEVVGSNGCETAYMWISIAQLEQLKDEVSILIEEYNNES